MAVSIRVEGADELMRFLDPLADPRKLDHESERALLVAGRYLRPKVRSEAPRRSGALQRSVSVRKGRRDRPSVLVGPRGKKAWYRHIVVGGARPHLIPGPVAFGGRVVSRVNHPGHGPNDFVERAGRRHERAAVDIYAKELLEGRR